MLVMVLMVMACGPGKGPGPSTEKGDSGGDRGTADTGASSADADGDGFDAPDDCDDTDASVHPGAEEQCGDGVDQDCDGEEVGCVGEIDADQAAGWIQASEATGVSLLGATPTVLEGWSDAGAPLIAVGASGSWVADGSWEDAEGLPNGAVFALDAHSWTAAHGESPSTIAAWRVDSRVTGAQFGGSLAAADFDGDGIDDLIVTAPGGFYSEHPDQDSIWIYPGPIVYGGWHDDLGGVELTHTDRKELPVNQVLTAHRSGPVDATGDGVPDFVALSTPGCVDGSPQAGWVLSGADTLGGELSHQAVRLSADSACEGDNGPGAALADVNGDGVLDFALGQELSDGAAVGAATPGIGLVAVFAGPLTDDRVASDADWRVVGVESGSDFGHTLSAGDVDGDGTDDLAIVARAEALDATHQGRVWLVEPTRTEDGRPADAVATGSVAIASTLEGFGARAAIVGNIDGEAGRELVISRQRTESDTSGEVLVFAGPVSGLATAVDATLSIRGTAPGQYLGLNGSGFPHLFDGGDLNGDGFDEFFIRASDDAARGSGSLYLFYGGAWPD